MKKKNGMAKAGWLFVIFGILCIGLKAVSPESVDGAGVLHELFFLLPIGFGALFSGMLLLVIAAVRNRIRNRKG